MKPSLTMSTSVQFDLTIVHIMVDFWLLSMHMSHTGNPDIIKQGVVG